MGGGLSSPDAALSVSKWAGGLTAVAEYYHKKLYEDPRALDYLHKRGLENLQNYDRFKLGFADGSLLNVIGESQKQTLMEIGILSDRGSEHFKNCIIFPIVDELDQVVGMYGRAIEPPLSSGHLPLSKWEQPVPGG